MIFKLSVFLALSVCFVAYTNAATLSSDKKLISDLFNDQYDRRIRPINNAEKSGPVVVTVNMYVRSVTKLENDELELQLTFRQKWKDERLSFSGDKDRYLNLISPEDLTWIPDTFFANEKSSNHHNLMMRNEYVRVWPNGDVLQSAKISLRLVCPMNYRNFPLDIQTCPLRLASYGYSTSDLIYRWEKQDPIQLKNIDLPTHGLQKTATTTCDSVTNTGTYSCLRADFTFKRAFTPYLNNIYIPFVMMVILAYLSFWINVKAITARTILLVVTLLVFSIKASNINETLPQVGYTKAVDLWTGVCLTFVFVALLEFIVVQYVARQDQNSNSTSDEENQAPSDIGKGQEGVQSKLKCMLQNVKNLTSLPEKLDGAFRIGFPIVFVIFVIAYAIAYCPSSSTD